jgi:predicted nuclease of predicted toxin-antitoxin system
MPWKATDPITKQDLSEFRRERKKTRFLVDEDVDPAVVNVLAESGYKAEHVSEVGLAGHPDENVLAYAKKKDRVLLTHDPDFLDDRKHPPQHNPGIVVLPGAQGNRRSLLDALDHVVRIIGDQRDLWRTTKISIAGDGTWSVRTFERDIGQVVKNRYRVGKGHAEVWVEEDD